MLSVPNSLVRNVTSPSRVALAIRQSDRAPDQVVDGFTGRLGCAPQECHAASRTTRYSWCSPLRIGVAPTREHGGSRWPGGCRPNLLGRRRRNAGAQTRMRACAIVVRHPFAQDPSKMSFVNGNHPIQALTPDRADYAFTESIGLRRPDRRFQHLHGPMAAIARSTAGA